MSVKWISLISVLVFFTTIEFAHSSECTSGRISEQKAHVDSFAGGLGGTISTKSSIQFCSDAEAKKFSKETAQAKSLESGFLCAVATTAFPPARVMVTVAASTACSVITSTASPELRKGDFVIEETSGAVWGGAGGFMHIYRAAVGKRDGTWSVLYFYSSNHNKIEVERWLDSVMKNFQRWTDEMPLIYRNPPRSPSDINISQMP